MRLDWNFNTPNNISTEFAIFTGIEINEKVSLIDINTFIVHYIIRHGLEYPGDRRKVIPNQALKNGLRIDEDVVTYPELQMYIKKNVIRL